MRANAYVLCPCACSVMSLCMLRVQDEFTVLNLAYAYATTSGVLRKAAILRHPVGRSDRELECAGGVEYQRGRVAIQQAFDGVVATMVRGSIAHGACWVTKV